MNYDFPNIYHIEDIRFAIKDRDEFVVAKRDWGYVVNYLVAKTDTFPATSEDKNIHYCPGCNRTSSEIEEEGCGSQRCPDLLNSAVVRRECRGMIFDLAGNIMARRLHKFFNVNEKDETLQNKLDLSQPHIILEKLDGSMVTPIQVSDHIRWGTKMGITDVSMNAEIFVAKHRHYQEFADKEMDLDNTPIFEWCSKKNKIVVDYPVDRLVLIAIRNNISGQYIPYNEMVRRARQYGIEYVKSYPGSASSMQSLIDNTRQSEGIEGWIIRFDDGHMVKVKGDWYVRIHKNKEAISQEKNILDLIVNDKLDDVLPFLLEEDLEAVITFEKDFWEGFDRQVDIYNKYFKMVTASGLDRKSYAQNWMPTIKAQDPFAPSIVFGCFDGKDISTMLLEHIRRNISTQTKVDSVRYLWNGYDWNHGQVDE